jgi:hypothetical protein
MSRQDQRVEVLEGGRDGGLPEVAHDRTLTRGRGMGALKRHQVLLDEMTKVLLLQLNHNPQVFQLPLNGSHMVTCLLTPTCQPS